MHLNGVSNEGRLEGFGSDIMEAFEEVIVKLV